MRLNLATVRTLFRTEMRMVLRDRRMIITSILLPLLITPLMFFGSSWSVKRHARQLEQMEIRYAVSGDGAEEARGLVSKLVQRREPPEAPKDTNKPPFRCVEVKTKDPKGSLNSGDIHLILESFADVAAFSDATNRPGVAAAAVPATNTAAQTKGLATKAGLPEIDMERGATDSPVILITFRADRHESSSALSRMSQQLREMRRAARGELLKSHGFAIEPSQVATISTVDVASNRQVAGQAIGRGLTVLLLLFILSSGAVVAIDSLAGEKERGTLETLLTTSAGRLEILAAKRLVIMAVALVITCIQLGNLVVYVGFKLLPLPGNLSAAVTPQSVLLLLFLYVPMAALAANVLLLVSGYARTYKEAQMYFLPVLLLGVVPALAPLLPAIPSRSAIVLVPVANIAVVVKEILVGEFDWPMITVSWAVTAVAAAWTGRRCVQVLMQERLVVAAETDETEFVGGTALFERRVWRWFAVLWAVLLVVSSYTDRMDLRVQISINLLGIFLGGCALMIRQYRLDPRRLIPWRAPHPAAWIGVLAAVPGGFIAATGISLITNRFIPAPHDMIETFTGTLFPEHIPFYQILLFLSVLPGICEELTFRGVLLSALRRRMQPAMAVLVTGLVFGFFHVALFRLAPTAVLGIMFAAVTLLTGSIYPAMLWHCLNNALGLVAFRRGFGESEMDATCYLAGLGLLAAGFWIFYRCRSTRRLQKHEPQGAS